MLLDCDWDALLESNDVDQWINVWNQKFMHVMETCIPKGTLPQRRNLPWLTKNLVRAMRKRKWLYRRAKVSGLPSWKNKYKAARNKALTMLRRAKQKYFDSCINSTSNKQFWKINL